MKSQNFIREKNTKTKTLNDIINKNRIQGQVLNRLKSKENNSTKTVFKLFTRPNENEGFLDNINIKKLNFNTDENNLTRIHSEKENKLQPKKSLHQLSQSMQFYLPIIDSKTPKMKKSPNCVYSTLDRIKKVENIFRTELRLRENIKKSIYNKSIDVVSVTESNYYQEGDLVKIDSEKVSCSIANDLSPRIKTEVSPFGYPQFPVIERLLKKRNPLKLMRRKNDYNVINGKISFPAIINDNELMRRIFNENMTHINKKMNHKTREAEIKR
jgi:hypothetical protein